MPPLPAGAPPFSIDEPAVTSRVIDMADLPKPPLRRRRILERPRLIRALDRSRARVRMLVAAPGYGKTTLAEQWAAQERRVAWIRARRSSADVAVLARQMAAAGAEIMPGCDRRLRERLNATADPADELDVLVDLLSEDLALWPEDAWIAVDDYQHIRESATAEAFVEGIIQQSPVQVLISTRDRPSWVSTRSVLYGDVLEIGQSLLAMSEEEVEDLLAGAHDGMSPGLLALAGGWPAVIGLASLTTTESPRPDEGLELPEQLYEFFADEVYRAMCEQFGQRDKSPSVFRRNVITRGVDLDSLIGREFEVQGVRFLGVESCKPCHWMDQAFCQRHWRRDASQQPGVNTIEHRPKEVHVFRIPLDEVDNRCAVEEQASDSR